mgnify:CR=1 FL=1
MSFVSPRPISFPPRGFTSGNIEGLGETKWDQSLSVYYNLFGILRTEALRKHAVFFTFEEIFFFNF